jgi:glycosyltransferase involved in cell wall biosynthesis
MSVSDAFRRSLLLQKDCVQVMQTAETMNFPNHPSAEVSQSNGIPRVSIGLPVYNGERYVAGAIQSLLSQSFRDLELVISDNASTDATESICRSFAEKDPRVHYFRNSSNIGLPRNYCRVFELSRAPYFKWAAHDDLHTTDFVATCVTALDRDPSIALCYTREQVIDELGKPLQERPYGLDSTLNSPSQRFRKILWLDLGSPAIFGLMRRDILRRTSLLGFSYASDQVLLAELSLYGRFHEISRNLLLHREHPHRSVFIHSTRHALAAWLDPAKAGRTLFPAWQLFADYLTAIRRAPIGFRDRRVCAWEMLRWVRYRWRDLLGDLTFAIRQSSLSSPDRLDATRT